MSLKATFLKNPMLQMLFSAAMFDKVNHGLKMEAGEVLKKCDSDKALA